jgi:hypothetical protein
MTEAPECYSYTHPDSRSVREAVELQRAHGMTFFRATAVNDSHLPVAPDEAVAGVWVEGWPSAPRDENSGRIEHDVRSL